MPPDTPNDILSGGLVLRTVDPSERVKRIARRANVSPDIADDYLRTTKIESGHNINVRPSSKGALGFGQVMPDVKGGSIRTVGGRQYNLKNPDENIEAGLRYFAEGGDDPVARRLHYFGGPGARKTYERTGRIPNISDGNMTATQYVKATGATPKTRIQEPDILRGGLVARPAQAPAASISTSVDTPDILKGGLVERPTTEPQGSWASSLYNQTPRAEKILPKWGKGKIGQGVAPSSASVAGEARQGSTPSAGDTVRAATRVAMGSTDLGRVLPTSVQDAVGEQLAKGESGLLQTVSAITKILPRSAQLGMRAPEPIERATQAIRAPINELANTLGRGGTEMAQQANRGVVSQAAQDVGGGMIASSPALVLQALGVPAPVAFGLDSYLKAEGRDADWKTVLKETGLGAASGALFELPLPARLNLLGRIGAKLGIVGGGTFGLEKLAGVDTKESAKNAAVNALFAATGAKKTEAPKEPFQTVPEAMQGKVRLGDIKSQAEQAGATVLNPEEVIAGRKPKIRLKNETQTETQPNVAAQPDSAQPPNVMGQVGIPRAAEGTRRANVRESVPESAAGISESVRGGVAVPASEPPRHAVRLREGANEQPSNAEQNPGNGVRFSPERGGSGNSASGGPDSSSQGLLPAQESAPQNRAILAPKQIAEPREGTNAGTNIQDRIPESVSGIEPQQLPGTQERDIARAVQSPVVATSESANPDVAGAAGIRQREMAGRPATAQEGRGTSEAPTQAEAIRHVDLQPRNNAGEFKPETRVEKEARREQVNQPPVESQPTTREPWQMTQAEFDRERPVILGYKFHGSPEGDIGEVDPYYHTKPWREGIGFYTTESAEKARSYAQGRTARGERRTGAGEKGRLNYVEGEPQKPLDMDAPTERPLWKEVADNLGVDEPADAKTNQEAYRGIIRDFNEENMAGEGQYAVEEVLGTKGYDASIHYEGKGEQRHKVTIYKGEYGTKNGEPFSTVMAKVVPPEEVHRRVVEQAIREGKPVPPEVLADYPDLQTKVAPSESISPSEIQVGDYIRTQGTEREASVNGEVVSIGRTNVKIRTLYNPGGLAEPIEQIHTIPKSLIAEAKRTAAAPQGAPPKVEGGVSVPKGWGSVETESDVMREMARQYRAKPEGAKGDPLPLPPLKNGVTSEQVQEAWDAVSSRYPRIAKLVKGIAQVEDLPARAEAIGGKRAMAAVDSNGLLWINAGDKLTTENAFHEITHIAQRARKGDAWKSVEAEAAAKNRGLQATRRRAAPPAPPPIDNRYKTSKGPGPKTPETTETPKEPSTTSARNAQMSSDRESLDLPELPPAERKSWRTSLENAKPERAGLLADEVLTKPRALNDEETASLVVRAQEIKNEHSRVMKEIGDAKDTDTIQTKRAQADALQREFDRLTAATKASGTEKGRTLAAQKLTINQDFDLVSVKQRMKAAKGRELTPEENKRYGDMVAERDQAIIDRDKAIENARTANLQREISRSQRRTRRAENRQALDTEVVTIKSNIAAEFVRLKTQQSKVLSQGGLGNLDPEGVITKELIRYARNRVKVNVGIKAEQLIDDVHSLVKDFTDKVSRRDIAELVSGYKMTAPERQPEDVRRLAGIRGEIKKLLGAEDVAAGKQTAAAQGPSRRLFSRNETRLKQLQKQEAELSRRLEEGDFSKKVKPEPIPYTREVYAKEKTVRDIEERLKREEYRATRDTMRKLADTAAGFGNIPKTMLSMADVSAVLRQGGIGVYQHPILSGRAGVDMLKAFTSHGFANVENAIKNSPRFRQAKRSGVEFTGVDKDSPQLSAHEEGYLGSGAIDTLAKGKLNPLRVVKGVKDFSERTFVSFLDSQRMRIFEQQAKALEGMGLKGKELDDALKSQAKYINIITGRGSLGVKGNQAAPLLNTAMFSPRLVASRFQYLNKMLNPVSWANTPKGARKLQMMDNAKFLFGVASTLALAKAAGASVSLDPDDADFLKIKAGNTRYDMLAGLQQPMRFMLRMSQAVKGGEMYAGEDKGKIALDFARSKSAPLAGYGWDFLEGKNRLSGKKFEAGKDLVGTIVPLPLQDFRDAIKEDGAVKGIAETFPTLFGVGTQTYKSSSEKPVTRAEKLTRKLIRDKMPSEGRTDEEIDRDQKLGELRAQSRQGVDVSKSLDALKSQGVIDERKEKSILSSRGVTRLQEGFKRLGLKEALTVYSTMSPGEQSSVKKILGEKAMTVDLLPVDDQKTVRAKLSGYGFKPGLQIPKKPTVDRPERPNPRAWSYQQ